MCAVLRACEWPERRSECALLSSLVQPHSFTPNLHVFGPPNCGKTAALLDVLRHKRCTTAFVDGLAVTSLRAATLSIVQQLNSSSTTVNTTTATTGTATTTTTTTTPPQQHQSVHGTPSRFIAGWSDLAIHFRSMPALLHNTAFIVVKQPDAIAALADSASTPTTKPTTTTTSSDGRVDEWLCGLLSLSDVCQRHITLIAIDRGGGSLTVGSSHTLLPIHFAAYSGAQLTSILGRSLLPPPASDVLLRFVSDAVNSFLNATADLREVHRIVSRLLALQAAAAERDTTLTAATTTTAAAHRQHHHHHHQQQQHHMFHAMRREVKELAANALYRVDYHFTVAATVGSSSTSNTDATGTAASFLSEAVEPSYYSETETGLAVWSRLLSRHLSLSQYYLLFASYIASHNSTQDDTRLFANELTKVSRQVQTTNANVVVKLLCQHLLMAYCHLGLLQLLPLHSTVSLCYVPCFLFACDCHNCQRKTRRDLSHSGRKGRTRDVSARLLPPKPFELERMIAIYNHIYQPQATELRQSTSRHTRRAASAGAGRTGEQLAANSYEMAASIQPYTQVRIISGQRVKTKDGCTSFCCRSY